MSTIVVVRKGGRAVIAADTFSTLGSIKTHSKYVANSEKIIRCGDSYLGVVGTAAHSQVLESLIRKYPKKLSFEGVGAIFETYLRIHPILKDEYFVRPFEEDDDEYESSQIEALVVNPRGIFGMFSWREVDEYKSFWAIGSGAQLALGAMFAVYERLDDPEEIARVGVEAGCEFDNGSGLPLTSYTVALRPQGKAGRAPVRRAR